jgi:lipopolysaccharide export system permease protein
VSRGRDRISRSGLFLFRKTLYRYLFREIWPTLIATLVAFIFIVLAARVLSISEWVINHGVPAADVGKILAYLIPSMVLFALPAALLMAVFVAFLRLSSDNEIMAFKSCGISLYQMLPPVLAVSVIGLVLGTSIAVFLVPWGNRSMKDLAFRIVRSKADLGIKERVFSEPFDRLTFYVSSFSSKEKVMRDLFLVDRRDPSVTTTIVAKEGMILNDPQGKVLVVHLLDGTVFTMEKKSQTARTIQFSTYDVSIPLEEMMPPDSLRKKSPQEMFVRELIRNLREGPKDKALYNEMAVELMGRFSIPLAVFLMGIIGAPLGSQIRVGGRSLGVGVSLMIFFVYYLFLAGVRSIGETGVISPFLGMWLPVLFLLISCGVLLRSAQKERTLGILDRFMRMRAP